MLHPLIVAVDIGSIAKNNFAWYSSDRMSGNKASCLADHVSKALNEGIPVALGFECPLYIPLREDENTLTSAREGEGTRAWSAGAGAGSLTTGLVQTAWILRAIRENVKIDAQAFLDWGQFSEQSNGLFLWEAFVSAKTKRGNHMEDAKTAVEAFKAALPDPTKSDKIQCASEFYSLAGASLLRAGWSKNLSLLNQKNIVIGP